MTALRNIRMLTRYTAWANRRLFQTLAGLQENELTKTRHIVFGNILRTLNHVYVIDLVWQAHLQGRPHGFTTRNPESHPTFLELRRAQELIDEWYIGYAGEATEPVCDEIVNFVFVGGGSGSMSRGDILLHVVNHTTYHRGNIAAMIYQIPAAPPTTDLPVFLRDTSKPRP